MILEYELQIRRFHFSGKHPKPDSRSTEYSGPKAALPALSLAFLAARNLELPNQPTCRSGARKAVGKTRVASPDDSPVSHQPR